MDYINAFLQYIEYEKRYSKHTVTSYRNDLLQFDVYGKKFFKTIHLADSNAIRSWILYLYPTHSSRTINRKISTLKSFYKYLLRQGIISINPLNKIISPKAKKRLPSFIEQSRMENLKMLPPVEKGLEGIQSKLIIELFYATGIRLSELVNLRESDYDSGNLTIKVLGKRNKQRIIPISRSLAIDIEAFIEEKNKLSLNEKNNYLFITKSGNKIYQKYVYRIVKRYLNLITTKTKKSPHILRHTFATHLLNNGAELTAIKEILGHANLSATQVYTHNSFEKLKSIYKQAHPRA